MASPVRRGGVNRRPQDRVRAVTARRHAATFLPPAAVKLRRVARHHLCFRGPGMSPRALFVPLGLSVLVGAAGCEPDKWLAGDIAISARPFYEPQTQVVIVHDVAPPTAAKIDGTPAPPGFDPVQARAAVEGVDLAMCWRPGGTHGTGVARVTFNAAGNVGLVEINQTVEGAAFDPDCMSRQFDSLRITPYAGAPIAVTANIIVG